MSILAAVDYIAFLKWLSTLVVSDSESCAGCVFSLLRTHGRTLEHFLFCLDQIILPGCPFFTLDKMRFTETKILKEQMVQSWANVICFLIDLVITISIQFYMSLKATISSLTKRLLL